MSDTAERVKKIVVEHLNVDAEKVTDTASFIEDLGADSLDTVELVMAFEEEFGIEIPDDAAEVHRHRRRRRQVHRQGERVSAAGTQSRCVVPLSQDWEWSRRSPATSRGRGRG